MTRHCMNSEVQCFFEEHFTIRHNQRFDISSSILYFSYPQPYISFFESLPFFDILVFPSPSFFLITSYYFLYFSIDMSVVEHTVEPMNNRLLLTLIVDVLFPDDFWRKVLEPSKSPFYRLFSGFHLFSALVPDIMKVMERRVA